jgi:hypothetical protein
MFLRVFDRRSVSRLADVWIVIWFVITAAPRRSQVDTQSQHISRCVIKT